MLDFTEVKKLMDESVEKKLVPCSDIAVMWKGNTVFRYFNGTRDEQKITPLQGDELYFLYSASKVITCTALLQLYENGKLDLEDRVCEYLPEWDASITIRHLLTMTSGLDYDIESSAILEQLRKNPDSSTREMVRAMAKKTLQFEPGSHFRYSLSHDVLAAVIEVISGMSFGEYLKKHIFEICGMENTGFQLTDEKRMCCQYRWNDDAKRAELIEKKNFLALTENYESGGAGLISTVEDYCKFAKKLLHGEELLKKETMDLMRRNHLHEQALKDFWQLRPGYGYGLGVRTDFLGQYTSKGEFGWDGAAGAYVILDPDQQISVFYATHILGHNTYLYQTLHPALRDAVYRAFAKEGFRQTG